MGDFIRQIFKNDPPKKVKADNKTYNLLGKCNNTLYLYEEEGTRFKTTFDMFQLGMVGTPEEKPSNKPHRINF